MGATDKEKYLRKVIKNLRLIEEDYEYFKDLREKHFIEKNIDTSEENTKKNLIIPILSTLLNISERKYIVSEYNTTTSSVDDTKRLDFLICYPENSRYLAIEAKPVDTELNDKVTDQLRDYIIKLANSNNKYDAKKKN